MNNKNIYFGQGHRFKSTLASSMPPSYAVHKRGQHYEKLSFSKTIHQNKLSEQPFLPPIPLQRDFFQPLPSHENKPNPINQEQRTVQYYRSKGNIYIENTYRQRPVIKYE